MLFFSLTRAAGKGVSLVGMLLRPFASPRDTVAWVRAKVHNHPAGERKARPSLDLTWIKAHPICDD